MDTRREPTLGVLFLIALATAVNAAPAVRSPGVVAKPKAAMMAFTTDLGSFQAGSTARQFSDLLQASLSAYEGVDWVERSDAARLREELELAAVGWVDAETRARGGQWEACDFLVFGRFESKAKPVLLLQIELVHPLRGELVGTLSLPFSPASLANGKAILKEVPGVGAASLALLKEVARDRADPNRGFSVGIIERIHYQSIRDISQEFSDVLSQATLPGSRIRVQASLRPHQGRREIDLLSAGFILASSAGWTNSSTALVVVVSSNTVKRTSSPTWTRTNETFDLGVFLLTPRGEYVTLGVTNLAAEALTNGYRELASKVLRVTAGLDSIRAGPSVRGSSGARKMADSLWRLTWERGGPSSDRHDLTTPAIRQHWLQMLQLIETACLLAPDDLSLRREQFRLRYLAASEMSQRNDPASLREMGDAWEQLMNDFAPTVSLTPRTAAESLNWVSFDDRRLLLGNHVRALTAARSTLMADFPPDAVARFIRLAEERVIDWGFRHALADPGSEAAIALDVAEFHCRLSDSIKRLAELRREFERQKSARLAEERKHRIILPRLAITADEPIDFQWERFYRVPNLLPPPAQVRLERLAVKRNAAITRVVDLCWHDGSVWLLTQGTEPRELSKSRENALEVSIESGVLNSWRVWRYSASDRGYQAVTGYETTNQFNRIFSRQGRIWIAGARLIELDPAALRAINNYPVPVGFVGPINQLVVQRSLLYVASSRGSAARFDFETTKWGVYPDLAQAILWFQTAATNHLPEAQLNLAKLYASGKGMPTNTAKAWLLASVASEASRHRLPEADLVIRRTETQLAPERLEALRLHLKTYLAEHPLQEPEWTRMLNTPLAP